MSRALTVIKCGGAVGVDPAVVAAGVAAVREAGDHVVLVHGGSSQIDRLAARLGVAVPVLTGPDGQTNRHTTAEVLDVVMMALAGQVKPGLVVELIRRGIPAVGLTGLDGGLLRARRREAVRAVVDGRPTVVRDDRSGRIHTVDAVVVEALIRDGVVAVVSPPALGDDHRPVNVNADRAAACLAVALGARRLVLLTGAPGVLADPGDEGSVLEHYRVPDRAHPRIGGGMVVKLHAARTAVRGGVAEVVIADGRRVEPMLRALAGAGGTRVLPDSAGTEGRAAVRRGTGMTARPARLGELSPAQQALVRARLRVDDIGGKPA